VNAPFRPFRYLLREQSRRPHPCWSGARRRLRPRVQRRLRSRPGLAVATQLAFARCSSCFPYNSCPCASPRG